MFALRKENKRMTFFSILGNSNLIYTIIRKRNIFHQLSALPTDYGTIQKSLNKRTKKLIQVTSTESGLQQSMEGSTPAQPAEPGTLKVTLAATPSQNSFTFHCCFGRVFNV